MNKEELLNKYIDLIDKGYCSDCNELNCIDNFPHAKITHAIREVQQENQELKKQLEEAQENIILLKASKPMLEYKKALEENQQKEFIKYLEDEKDRLARICNNLGEDKFDEADDILQKYKEIIGVSDDKK